MNLHKKIINIDEICKGCKSYMSCGKDCPVNSTSGAFIRPNRYVPDGIVCPCSICLVKGMCKLNGEYCFELLNYHAISSLHTMMLQNKTYLDI